MTRPFPTRILFAGLLLLAFLLRLPAFFWGLPSRTRTLASYHGDEAINFHVMERWDPKRWQFPPGDALYWGMVHLYTLAAMEKAAEVVGYVHPGGRAFYLQDLRWADRLYKVARGLSVFLGLVTVWIGYWAGKTMFGQTEGLLMAALCAIVPVQVVATIYARIDCFLVFWGLVVMAVSSKLLIEVRPRTVLFSGILCGLAAATKYTAGIFGLLPLMALIFSKDKKVQHFFLLICGGILGFSLGCPVVIFDFSTLRHFLMGVYRAGTGISANSAGFGPWPIGYLRYLLPAALGYPLMIWSLGGLVWLCWHGNRTDRWLLSSFAITYAVITLPGRQFTLYALPLIPYLITVAARTMTTWQQDYTGMQRVIGQIIFASCVGWCFLYTIAYTQLYWHDDARDMASAWIESHIPKGSAIGITHSFFWTPPVLRAYNTPYKVIDPNRDGDSDEVRATRLDAISAPYFVLSDFETRDYERVPAIAPKYAAALHRLMTVRYTEIVRFETAPHLGPFSWPKRYPPWDWMFPNPTIRIFKSRMG